MPVEPATDETCLARQVRGGCPYVSHDADAWLNTLENGDYAHAKRIMDMPPQMAAAYVSVEVRQGFARLEAKIDESRRRPWDGAWKGVVGAVGALLAAYGASKGGVAPP